MLLAASSDYVEGGVRQRGRGVRGARGKVWNVDSIGVCCKLHLYE